MKAICLVIFYFLMLNPSRAQLQLPFPDSTGAWIYTEAWGGGQPWDPVYHFRYKLVVNGDTLINSLNYSRLLVSTNIDVNDSTYFDVVGYFRIDSLKIYFIDNANVSAFNFPYAQYAFGTSNEILLYDYGLQVGDSFEIQTMFVPGDKAVVTAIDSVQLNGTYYKRWIFSGGGHPCDHPLTFYYYWIEGLGSSLGFYPYYFCFENSIFFHCFHQNGLDYINYLPPGNTCQNITLGTGHLIDYSTIQLFPNPTNGHFNIECSNVTCITTGIYDFQGTLLKTIPLQPGSNQIDITNFPFGIYFFRFENKVYPLMKTF